MIDRIRTVLPNLIQSKSFPWIWRDADRGIVVDVQIRTIVFERMADCDELADRLGAAVKEKRNFSLIYRDGSEWLDELVAHTQKLGLYEV